MTLPSPDQNPKEQQEFQEVIPLDKTMIRALGRGLREQIFTDNFLDDIRSNTASLRDIDGVDKEWVSFLSSSVEKIRKFIDSMETSKEVRLVMAKRSAQRSEDNHWEFSFSDEKEQKETPEESKILINKNLRQKLKSALSHHIGAHFTSIYGFAELIEKRADNDSAKSLGKKIREAYDIVAPKFDSLRIGEKEIMLNTDNNENTSIIQL